MGSRFWISSFRIVCWSISRRYPDYIGTAVLAIEGNSITQSACFGGVLALLYK